MHPKLRNINARLFEKALKRDGFILVHQKGSHKSYFKGNRLVTLSFHHLRDSFPPKTLKSMIRQAGWSEKYLAGLFR